MHATSATKRSTGPQWMRLGVVATLAAVVVVTLDVLLIRWMDASRHTSDDTAVATYRLPDVTGTNSVSPPPAASPGSGGSLANPDQYPDKETRPEPRATKDLEPATSPTVVIKRLEPAEPQ